MQTRLIFLHAKRIDMPLKKDVAKKFQTVNWKGGDAQIFGRFGTVDLSKLTIKQAENLIKRGFSKLAKKKKVEEVEVVTPAPSAAE